MSVDLPKTHKSGGQSSVRFGRLADEARHVYSSSAADIVLQHLWKGHAPTVVGIIVAGPAEQKDRLLQMLDPRVQKLVIATITVARGGEAGLQEAIDKSGEAIACAGLRAELSAMQDFDTHISADTGLAAYGFESVLAALEAGAVQQLLVSDEVPLWTTRDEEPGAAAVIPEARAAAGAVDRAPMPVPAARATAPLHFAGRTWYRGAPPAAMDSRTSSAVLSFTDWAKAHAADFGADLTLVRGISAAGHRLLHGYGGLAAVMHYKFDADGCASE